jgi:hypothetical protein
VAVGWKAFLERSPSITSLASVAIALMAFFLTIYNAKLDREYKELSIHPALHLDVEASDFHVGYVNKGLGPAVVKNIATKFNSDKCLLLYRRQMQSEDDLTKGMDKVFEHVLRPIEEYFADPLAKLTDPNDIWDQKKYPKLYARTITPEQIISPGEEFVIFKLQEDQLAVANERLATLSSDDYNAIIRRFMERGYTMPYYLNFCSLTGSYCVHQIEDSCGITQ